MARKSLLGPTLFTIGGVILLLGLGTWQLQRLHWKEGLIAAREAGMSAPPVALPATAAAAGALEYHRVRAEGHFLVERELYLHAVTEDGSPGFHVLTPLALADGRTVIVDRGFVPIERKAPESRAAGNAPGTRVVTGLLRLAPTGKPSWFVPDNRPDRNEWFYFDLAAMAAASRLGEVAPFYLAADATPNPGGFPQGGQAPPDLPNDHLQYAITWYALAGGLVIVYIVLARRRAGEQT